MRLTAEKYAPLDFLMGLALLIGLSVISYRSLNDLTQTADEVTNTHLVMNKLEKYVWVIVPDGRIWIAARIIINIGRAPY